MAKNQSDKQMVRLFTFLHRCPDFKELFLSISEQLVVPSLITGRHCCVGSDLNMLQVAHFRSNNEL